MAVTNVSATHQDAVRPQLKSSENEVGRNPAGTHHPDQPDVGRVLKAADAGQIGTGISAPVAAKSNDLRLELRSHRVYSFCTCPDSLFKSRRARRNTKNSISFFSIAFVIFVSLVVQIKSNSYEKSAKLKL
jgi:hypothetical protein